VDDLAAMRRSYELGGLSEDDLAPTWLAQAERWIADAVAAGVTEPNAMVVATADEHGRPSARTVLLKGLDERGFVFYTNFGSRKGRELAANPQASLVFPWIALQRQLLAAGPVERVADDEADAYFASRPVGSRLGAHASPQSRPVGSRAELERARDEAAARFGDDPPRPEGWGGFRLVPDRVEVWQGRPDRLHDRFQWTRSADGSWLVERLAP
jgi:pyridoxamine 5'-phosphate oxidase